MSFLQSLFGPPDVEKLKAEGNIKGLEKALRYREGRYDSKHIRYSAAKALSKLKPARSVKPLIAVFEDWYGDDTVRSAAAEALGEIGTPAVESLITVLKKGTIRSDHAAKVLGKIGDARAVEPLISALKSYISREEAAEALGKIKDVRAVEPLIAALKDRYSDVNKASRPLNNQDSEEKALQVVIDALVEIRDARAVKPLIALIAIQDKTYSMVKERMVDAVVKFGTAAVEPLIAALGDTGYAAQALGKIGDARVVELLIARLDDLRYFYSTADALKKLYHSESLDAKHKSLILAQRGRTFRLHEDRAARGGPHVDEGGEWLGAYNHDDTNHFDKYKQETFIL